MRINKSLVAAALVLVVFLVAPSLSFAQSVDQLQAQIQALLAQVAQLQAQLAAQQGTTQQWCHTFNTNLGMGSSGSEVSALQAALIKEGVGAKENWTGGTFDKGTAAAVTGLQGKYKDEILTPSGLANGTGYVGKATRAKLNGLYGCGVQAEQACPLLMPAAPNWCSGGTITPGGIDANGCRLAPSCSTSATST